MVLGMYIRLQHTRAAAQPCISAQARFLRERQRRRHRPRCGRSAACRRSARFHEPCSPRIDSKTRRMPISLVIDPAEESRIVQEEIFGPILPVVPYDDLDETVLCINAGERPLGL